MLPGNARDDQQTDPEIRWRCDGTVYGDLMCSIFFESFRVVKTTICGEWLDVYGTNKFILRDAQKRYAYPTKKEALVSFIRRKARQSLILTGQLKRADTLHKAALVKVSKGNFLDSAERLPLRPIFDSVADIPTKEK